MRSLNIILLNHCSWQLAKVKMKHSIWRLLNFLQIFIVDSSQWWFLVQDFRGRLRSEWLIKLNRTISRFAIWPRRDITLVSSFYCSSNWRSTLSQIAAFVSSDFCLWLYSWISQNCFRFHSSNRHKLLFILMKNFNCSWLELRNWVLSRNELMNSCFAGLKMLGSIVLSYFACSLRFKKLSC